MNKILDNSNEKKNSSVNIQKKYRTAAVALKKIGIEEGLIPKIIASGYGKLAEEILELAFNNGIKVRKDNDLVQILSAIELDSEIPSEALVAVAEILSYVYKVNINYKPVEENKN